MAVNDHLTALRPGPRVPPTPRQGQSDAAPFQPAGGPLLVVEDARIGYQSAGGFVEAVREVSFEMRMDERLMIIGPSGCGKSTLLRTVAGFQRLTGGRLIFDGREDLAPGPDRAMVFQEFDQLFPWLRVIDNVAQPLRYVGASKAEARSRAQKHLSLMGLDDAAGRYPHQLSGGMKQRVAIARALALHPRLLLMDEPFGSLDALTRARLQREVMSMTRRLGVAVLFVTHSIDEALTVGDRLLVMSPPPAVVRAVITVPGPDAPESERHATIERLHHLLGDAPVPETPPHD